ncbi:MAG: hypothetical protein ACKOEM_01390 [Planctomycetia bacterium]
MRRRLGVLGLEMADECRLHGRSLLGHGFGKAGLLADVSGEVV